MGEHDDGRIPVLFRNSSAKREVVLRKAVTESDPLQVQNACSLKPLIFVQNKRGRIIRFLL